MFQRALRERTWEIDRNNVAVWMIVGLQNLSITVKAISLKKDSFSDAQNPKTVCQHIDSGWQALSA